MFDIAFSELVVIGTVAVIVIGPEKLPKIARTAGHLLGRAQRYVNSVKSEINSELRVEELKGSLQSLQDEIRQHAQADAAPYQVGQVIRHEAPTESPQYQVGQVIYHDMSPTADPAQPAPILKKTAEPAALAQGGSN